MTIGRINAGKTVAIAANAENTQPAERPKSPTVKLAKDTYEETKPPNDLTKALGQNTAQLKNIVQAGESANPTLNPGTGQSRENYGTLNGSIFNLPKDQPDRFGFNMNPEDTDLKQQLDQRTGLAFDPNRDLNIPDGGNLSTSTNTNPLAKPKTSDNSDTKSLQDQNKSLKQENDFLRAQLIQLQTQQILDQIDKRNAYIDQKSKEAMDYANKAMAEAQKSQQAAKNPNPDAPDNSSGGPMNPLINNLGSPMRIRQPFVDPVNEQGFGPSGVMRGRDQAVDPNPDADPNIGAAEKAILSTSDAVTDPTPDLGTLLQNLRDEE